MFCSVTANPKIEAVHLTKDPLPDSGIYQVLNDRIADPKNVWFLLTSIWAEPLVLEEKEFNILPN